MASPPPDEESAAYPRRETLTRANSPAVQQAARGVKLLTFVSRELGSIGLCTGMATFQPGTEVPYHTHDISEAVTVLRGQAVVVVESRHYRLTQYDAIHVPAGVPHLFRNGMPDSATVLHLAYASDEPRCTFAHQRYTDSFRGKPLENPPEILRRFARMEVYELAPGAFFRDLFGSRYGAKGICGGYGLFRPGAGLPCHTHEYDESITIVEGAAVLEAAGNKHTLSNCDTACAPRGLPHRFVNRSNQMMAMIWVYGGDEPRRTVLDQTCCETSIVGGGPEKRG